MQVVAVYAVDYYYYFGSKIEFVSWLHIIVHYERIHTRIAHARTELFVCLNLLLLLLFVAELKR